MTNWFCTFNYFLVESMYTYTFMIVYLQFFYLFQWRGMQLKLLCEKKSMCQQFQQFLLVHHVNKIVAIKLYITYWLCTCNNCNFHFLYTYTFMIVYLEKNFFFQWWGMQLKFLCEKRIMCQPFQQPLPFY